MGPNTNPCIVDVEKVGIICVNVLLTEDEESQLHEILSSVNESSEDDDYLCPADFPEVIDSFSEELWYTINSQVEEEICSYLVEHDLQEFDSDEVPSYTYISYPGMSEEAFELLVEKYNLYPFLAEES